MCILIIHNHHTDVKAVIRINSRESGCFICGTWWDNPNTTAVMSVGEAAGPRTGPKEILVNALAILTRERVGDCAGGQAAFDARAGAVSDDGQLAGAPCFPCFSSG